MMKDLVFISFHKIIVTYLVLIGRSNFPRVIGNIHTRYL